MIILDIDQDYFFLPVLSGKLLRDREERNKFFFPAQTNIETVFKTFRLDPSIPFEIFDDHDSVYHSIAKMKSEKHILIHLDAHDDVCHKQALGPLDIGNWITHLVMEELIDPNIFWINQRSIKCHVERYVVMGKPYVLNTSRLEEFSFNSKVDKIFYTRSKEFCPDNNVEQRFCNLMKNRG